MKKKNNLIIERKSNFAALLFLSSIFANDNEKLQKNLYV